MSPLIRGALDNPRKNRRAQASVTPGRVIMEGEKRTLSSSLIDCFAQIAGE